MENFPKPFDSKILPALTLCFQKTKHTEMLNIALPIGNAILICNDAPEALGKHAMKMKTD